MRLLRFLIGFLWYFRLFWLAVVITLVLVYDTQSKSALLYSRFHFTFYQTTLPGKRDTKVRETVSTDMRILSASGSKMVPKTDFWFLKFLAMKPSSYKKKMWILTFKALMAASLTSDSYLMHRLEGTVHVPHLRISRENGYQVWVQWKALVVYSWWYSKQPY